MEELNVKGKVIAISVALVLLLGLVLLVFTIHRILLHSQFAESSLIIGLLGSPFVCVAAVRWLMSEVLKRNPDFYDTSYFEMLVDHNPQLGLWVLPTIGIHRWSSPMIIMVLLAIMLGCSIIGGLIST